MRSFDDARCTLYADSYSTLVLMLWALASGSWCYWVLPSLGRASNGLVVSSVICNNGSDRYSVITVHRAICLYVFGLSTGLVGVVAIMLIVGIVLLGLVSMVIWVPTFGLDIGNRMRVGSLLGCALDSDVALDHGCLIGTCVVSN